MTALIFDTETHKLHGEIIEAAWMNVKLQDNRLSSDFQYYGSQRYKPSEPINLVAMAVHNIVDEDLEDCLPSSKFQFPAGAEVEYLIGHNIDYDIEAVKRVGVDTSNIKPICTLAMARYLWPKLESYKLSVLAYFIHPRNEHKNARQLIKEAHGAFTDVQMTLLLLDEIRKQRGIHTFEELYEFSEMARYPTHIFYGKYKGWAIKDMDDKDIHWLMGKTDDEYLRTSLENELLERSNINENEELPF
ncbi:DNA polymerase III subunit epsilon [Acinetobacter sp. LoGeW2-3]|uniref:3'-5' exonuclease n=1 Tax=Acinetobacter sp. LoGeW2-3 TaxID=1808001 RepID=UPI000C05CCED|nr:3'-5' exonuclease [Acinetobacter sp. LoGeW2-3]ATO20030.1 DNA polymerase III subunit epsilon [Acinetobacter sp. LoGeW2-3]